MKLALPLVFVGVMLLQVLVPVTPSKILVVAFISTKSHKITYMGLIEELAKRGHEITVLTPVKPFKNIPNVTEVFTMDVEEKMKDMNVFDMKENDKSLGPLIMLKAFSEACSLTYDLPHVKEILNQKFDLILLQPFFNDCALGLIWKLQAPLVLFFPSAVPSFLVSKIGGHFPPSFNPNFALGYPFQKVMTFYQRFLNFGVTILMDLIIDFYYEPKMTALYREKLGNDVPTVAEILANTSLILSNSHFSLNGHKPYLPDVIDVGGIHNHPSKPLPKDLEEFVAKSGKEGFILFSMGSAIPGSLMSEAKRKMFLNVFSKLKQQVLWKWETETMTDLPKNVKLSKWLPQQDVLGHPNIRLFITHCGGGGTEEAIYHGVPLLGMPMLGDQPMNAQKAKNLGFLIDLEWNTLTEDQLMNGVQEILNNSTYRDNVKKLSKVFKDQVDDPLQRGVYWIEYIIRHKGAPHLRSASRKLNFIQYHSIDVLAAYFAILALIVGTFYKTLRWLCCRSAKKKTSDKKKRQ